jgi:hypothetical protein
MHNIYHQTGKFIVDTMVIGKITNPVNSPHPVFKWCVENIGQFRKDWDICCYDIQNNLHTFEFAKSEHATAFALKWT